MNRIFSVIHLKSGTAGRFVMIPVNDRPYGAIQWVNTGL